MAKNNENEPQKCVIEIIPRLPLPFLAWLGMFLAWNIIADKKGLT